MFAYGERSGAPVYVYRLPNLFGKWCRPNYNSVVATFCHHIARGLPVTVNDPSARLSLVYIDDLCREFLRALAGRPHQRDRYCGVYPEYPINVADLELTLRFLPKAGKTGWCPIWIRTALLLSCTPAISAICRRMDSPIPFDPYR